MVIRGDRIGMIGVARSTSSLIYDFIDCMSFV